MASPIASLPTAGGLFPNTTSASSAWWATYLVEAHAASTSA